MRQFESSEMYALELGKRLLDAAMAKPKLEKTAYEQLLDAAQDALSTLLDIKETSQSIHIPTLIALKDAIKRAKSE